MLPFISALMFGGADDVAKWNISDRYSSGISLSDDARTATWGINKGGIRGTIGKSGSGKYYFEVVVGGSAPTLASIGFATGSVTLDLTALVQGPTYGYASNGDIVSAGGVLAGSSFTVGDIVSIATDFTALKFYVAKNGVYQASGNPNTGTNGISISTSNPLFPIGIVSGSSSTTLRLASGNYTPPTGYQLWPAVSV